MVTRSRFVMDDVTDNAITCGRTPKKRALGHVPLRRYTPSHSAVSCIGIFSDRTNRSASSLDFGHEQNKLITDPGILIRSQSAPSNRHQRHRMPQRSHQSGKKLFTPSITRVRTPQVETPRSIVCRLQRPKTTGHFDKIKSSLQPCIIVGDYDLDEEEIKRKKDEISHQIRLQWHPTNHDLNFGEFVKGQGKNTGTVYAASYNTWVTFVETASEEDRLADTLTLCEDEDNFYNIDSNAGSLVAQQLLHGEKIRIGVNGAMHPRTKIRDTAARGDKPDESDNSHNASSVPLSWEDQLSRPGITVMQAKSRPLEVKVPKTRNTQHVVYEKFFSTPEPRPLLTSHRSNEHRTRTNTSLQKSARRQSYPCSLDGHEIDEDICSMTIDEILHHRTSKSTEVREQSPRVPDSTLNTKNNHLPHGLKKSQPSVLVEKSNIYNKNFSRPISSICRRSSYQVDLSIDLMNRDDEQRRGHCRNGVVRLGRQKSGISPNGHLDRNVEFIKFSSQIAAGKDAVVLKAAAAAASASTVALEQHVASSVTQASVVTHATHGPDIDTFETMSPLRTNSPASANDSRCSSPVHIPTASPDRCAGIECPKLPVNCPSQGKKIDKSSISENSNDILHDPSSTPESRLSNEECPTPQCETGGSHSNPHNGAERNAAPPRTISVHFNPHPEYIDDNSDVQDSL